MRSSRAAALAVVVAAIIATAAVCAAQTSVDDANRLYQAQQFAQAAQAFEVVVKSDPGNAKAWYRLGISLMQSGNAPAAQAPLEKALALGFIPQYTLYALAEQQAQTGHAQNAVDYLRKSFAYGALPPKVLEGDDALKPIQTRPDYLALLQQSKDKYEPCAHDQKFHAFDFWAGDWTVRNAVTGAAGKSHVERILDGCVIFENWTDGYGYQGKSFSFYDPVSGRWTQHWVDEFAGFRDWSGQVQGASMIFTTSTNAGTQKEQRMRMTYTPLSGGGMRQLIEVSTDAGKTWQTSFDGYYTRARSLGDASRAESQFPGCVAMSCIARERVR